MTAPDTSALAPDRTVMTALDRLRNPDHVVPMHTARLVDQVDLDWLLGEHEKDAEALRALVKGWEAVEPEVNNLFLIQHARTGLHYDGPQDFAVALKAARARLAGRTGDA